MSASTIPQATIRQALQAVRQRGEACTEVSPKSALAKEKLKLVGTQTPFFAIGGEFPSAKVYLGSDGKSVFERFPGEPYSKTTFYCGEVAGK